MMKRGYYTVEATFVMMITILIFLSICLGGMYVHDKVILSSVANQHLASWISSEKQMKEQKWETSLKEKLEKKLLLLQVKKIEASKHLLFRKVEIKVSVPITEPFVKKVLLKGKKEMSFKITREDITPANYMWDVRK